MALNRRFLKECGIEEEIADKIMSEYGKAFENMIPKSQAEEDSKKALEDFQQKWEKDHPKVEVKDTDVYKDLESKYNDLVFDGQMRSAKVKEKYKDFVKSKIAKDKPFEESIKEIKAEYAEFFESDEPMPEKKGNEPKPTVGGQTQKEGPECPRRGSCRIPEAARGMSRTGRRPR